MARVKRGPKRAAKRKKVLKLASGFFGTKSKAYRMAQQAVDKALGYAYVDRRKKKRNFRSLWILRINAAARINGLSYNRLIAGLKAAGSTLDRKSLADLAVRDAKTFAEIAGVAKKALADAPAQAAPVVKTAAPKAARKQSAGAAAASAAKSAKAAKAAAKAAE
jgi:large subunit ribosomal protein L20